MTTSPNQPAMATPRTDAEAMQLGTSRPDTEIVWADFARTLERELQEASEQLAAKSAPADLREVIRKVTREVMKRAVALKEGRMGTVTCQEFYDETDAMVLSALTPALAAKSEDSALVDWLESHPFMFYRDRDEGKLIDHFTLVDEDAGRKDGRRGIIAKTARAAIRAARQTKGAT